VPGDLELPPSSLRPRLIAAAGAAALSALSDFYDEEQIVSDPIAVLDDALTFLRGGIAALRDQPRIDP